MFGLGKSNKKRTNRRSRRTSKRRSSRRQRGGNADLASAYGAAPAAGGADAKEDFAGMLPESFANHGPAKGHDSKDVAGAPPAGGAPPAAAAPQKGGAGAPPAKGGRRRRGSKGRKSFGTGEMSAAALALANFYGPGAKSRRNRRKSRRNRSQRRR